MPTGAGLKAGSSEVIMETFQGRTGPNGDMDERNAVDVWEHASTSNIAEVETAIPAIIEKGGDIPTGQAAQDVFVTELRDAADPTALKTEWITSLHDEDGPSTLLGATFVEASAAEPGGDHGLVFQHVFEEQSDADMPAESLDGDFDGDGSIDGADF
jgi:hypothetical protein